jgi:hypothetical protein
MPLIGRAPAGLMRTLALVCRCAFRDQKIHAAQLFPRLHIFKDVQPLLPPFIDEGVGCPRDGAHLCREASSLMIGIAWCALACGSSLLVSACCQHASYISKDQALLCHVMSWGAREKHASQAAGGSLQQQLQVRCPRCAPPAGATAASWLN